MKASEWQEKSEAEREKALLELSDKLRKLRFDLSTREAKNHSDYRKMKKDIARLLTLKSLGEVEVVTPVVVK
ncbi:MAG: 50S ribosomal protein L29 [Candidatus Moranbacteria bacterium]|jgi:ribosomal protein L29|nr:50S ribosomal protein L29 [Candidatus Moranbacteria bacterium]